MFDSLSASVYNKGDIMQVKIKSTIQDPNIKGRVMLDAFIASKAMEWETECKRIISNESVDTGELLNSIHIELNKFGFTGISSAKHAKYLEFGTIKHWVPFYGKGGEPVLADWARRVLGMSREDMEKMKGMMVHNEELAMMRRALNKL